MCYNQRKYKNEVDMKKIYLIALGFVPLIIGLSYNTIIMNMYVNHIILNIIAIVIWLALGVFVSKKTESMVKSTCYVHLMPTIFLLFILFQIIVIGNFYMNAIGFISQMPFLMFAGVAGLVCRVVSSTISTLMIYIAAYIIQIVIFMIGYKIGDRKRS